MKNVLIIISLFFLHSLLFNEVIFPQSYASMYVTTNNTQSGITGWKVISGFTTGELSSDFSFTSNRLTKSISSSTALYLVSFSASFGGTTTGLWNIGVSVNGADPSDLRIGRYLANNDTGNVSAGAYISLAPGDSLSLKILPFGTANLTTSFASVCLVRIEDIASYNSYAEMGFNNSSASITLNNSYLTITNALFTGTNLIDWTHSAGVLTAGPGSEGIYLVSASFNFNGLANTSYSVGISLNNGNPTNIIGSRKIGTSNDIGNISVWGLISISDGNTIRLKAKSSAINKSITIKHCHIYLTKINGSGISLENYPYASMIVSNTSPTPIVLTAGINNKITGYSNNITDNNYWNFNSSEFLPIGVSAGYYRINYYISYSTNPASTVKFAVFKNNVEILQLVSERTTSSTDRGSVGANGIILIEIPTDRIRLTATPLANADLSVYSSRLCLSRIEKTSDTPLPVELSSFSATMIGSTIKLSWKTATEVKNYGFDVERNVHTSTPLSVTNWEKLGFVNGNGNSNSPKNYSFIDTKVSTGKYSYRLKQIDNNGQFEYSKTIEVDFNAPNNFELSQNYLNPFNPTTTIRFNLPEASIVKLRIFNILGQEIRTLVNEFKESGTHTINFNASELSSGMYIYKIEAGSFVQTRKMTLLK